MSSRLRLRPRTRTRRGWTNKRWPRSQSNARRAPSSLDRTEGRTNTTRTCASLQRRGASHSNLSNDNRATTLHLNRLLLHHVGQDGGGRFAAGRSAIGPEASVALEAAKDLVVRDTRFGRGKGRRSNGALSGSRRLRRFWRSSKSHPGNSRTTTSTIYGEQCRKDGELNIGSSPNLASNPDSSRKWKFIFDKTGTQIRSSTASQRRDGRRTDRVNKTVEQLVTLHAERKYEMEKPPYPKLEYNTNEDSGNGTSPCKAVYGHTTRGRLSSSATVPTYPTWRIFSETSTTSGATPDSTKAQEIYKQRVDGHNDPTAFKEGDKVRPSSKNSERAGNLLRSFI